MGFLIWRHGQIQNLANRKNWGIDQKCPEVSEAGVGDCHQCLETYYQISMNHNLQYVGLTYAV